MADETVAPSPAPDPWEALSTRVEDVVELVTHPRGKFRRWAETKKFIAWLKEQSVKPDDLAARAAEILQLWDLHLGVSGGKRTMAQGLAQTAAKFVLQEEDNMRNGRPLPPRFVPVPKVVESEPEEDDRDEDENEGEEVEPSRAAAPPPQPQLPPQVVYAAPPPGYAPLPYGYPQAPQAPTRGRGRPSTNPAFAPRAAPASRIIPQNLREKIRVYHRGVGGKREPVMEYTLADLGGASLETFIHEYVDPEFGDQGAPENVYDVYEVGPGGDDRGAPATITVRNRDQQQVNPNDPIAQTRNVLELLEDVRSREDSRRQNSQALLDEFKKKAVGGNDMNSMMMLMMMERFMGGSGGTNPEAIVLKVMEKLQGVGTPPAVPFAPPPPPAGSSTLDKLTELLAATALRPPPQPKTLTEQMAELKLLKEVFAPAPTTPTIPPELVTLLAKMSEKLDRPRGGVEEALSHFDKIRTMVKELAPQVNAGGITGAIQGILTPELARAVGNTFAGAIEKAKEGAAATPTKTALPANTQPVSPVQATPTPQPDVIPPEVIKAVETFKTTKDTTKARDALIELLRAMYEKMPQQAVRLDPVLGEVLKGNFEPARKTLKEILLSAQRPELDNPVFIDRTVAALISNFGGTPPKELLHEAEVVEFPTPKHNIPTAAESEAKDKAEREARKANGVESTPAASPSPSNQPSLSAAHQPSNIA